MNRPFAYSIALTQDEYRSAAYMDARGYLGGIIEHCAAEDWQEDGSVVLQFNESDAWAVQEQCMEDEPAVWALTTPSTSLGRKLQAFLDSIV